MNYESLDTIELYNHPIHPNISKDAINRIKQAWEKGQLIIFERANGSPIYIKGVEHKKEHDVRLIINNNIITGFSDDEWFVEIDRDGLPETIIGGTYDLIEYMESHLADWFEVLEIRI